VSNEAAVLRPTQTVHPVTNGTSALERLPDHLLTTFGSGTREIGGGLAPASFFVRELVPRRRHPYGGLAGTGGIGLWAWKFAPIAHPNDVTQDGKPCWAGDKRTQEGG
jgi:hypothetical protein